MPRKSQLLADLTSQIGYEGTIELLRAWGGRRLQIPVEMTATHPIALRLGLSTAGQISYWYGGQQLDLPAERNALIDVRNDRIIGDLERGHSVKACAIRYGVTPRHIRKIRAQRAGAEL